MYNDYRDQGFVPLAINLWQDMNSVVKPYARQYGYQFLRDAGSVWNQYKIQSYIPLNYVIDTAGVVVYGAEGFSETVLRAYIEASLPPTGVEEGTAKPLNAVSMTPNPTAGPMTVSFTLGRPGNVALKVYSSSGKLVRTVHEGSMSAGSTSLTWNLLNDNGSRVTAGMYFMELTAGSACEQVKVSVLR